MPALIARITYETFRSISLVGFLVVAPALLRRVRERVDRSHTGFADSTECRTDCGYERRCGA